MNSKLNLMFELGPKNRWKKLQRLDLLMKVPIVLDPPCRHGREATVRYVRVSAVKTGWLADNSKEWHFLDRSYVTQRHISPKIHPSTTKSLFLVCFQKITKIDVQNGVPVVAVMNG